MEKSSFWFIAFLILGIWFWSSNSSKNKEIERWKEEYFDCKNSLFTLNRSIENAKYYSGESYDDMVDALDSLNTSY